MCVSQLGSANAALNIAAAASASASSTLDPSHGAAVAIDGLASAYWVSKMDVAGGVTLECLRAPCMHQTLRAPAAYISMSCAACELVSAPVVLQAALLQQKWARRVRKDPLVCVFFLSCVLPCSGQPDRYVRVLFLLPMQARYPGQRPNFTLLGGRALACRQHVRSHCHCPRAAFVISCLVCHLPLAWLTAGPGTVVRFENFGRQQSGVALRVFG